MDHKIYGLYAEVDAAGLPKIRYVGYTSKTLKTRLIQHLSEARNGSQSHRCKWIRFAIANGSFPKILLLETVTTDDWQERERFWISSFDVKLTNGTTGGDGLINPSKDVRERISKKVSELLKGNSRRAGIGHTPETKERVSKSLRESSKARDAWDRKRGVPLSDEWKKNVSVSLTGIKRTDEQRAARKLLALENSAEYLKRLPGLGSKWVNNGTEEKLLNPGEGLPVGYVQGRLKGERFRNKTQVVRKHSPESVAKRSAGMLGYKWINNGEIARRLPAEELIPDGWHFGKKIVIPEGKK